MPSLLEFYKSKPHQYISWIIGHEGRGEFSRAEGSMDRYHHG